MVGREMTSVPGEDFFLTAVRMKWIVLSTEYRGHTNNPARLHAQILDGLKLDEVNPTVSTQYCRLAEFLQIRL